MIGANSENEAEFAKGEEGSFYEFLLDVWDVFEEGLRGVVVANGLFIDVTSSPLIIHQSNSIIENGSYLLYLTLLFSQQFYSSVHDDL